MQVVHVLAGSSACGRVEPASWRRGRGHHRREYLLLVTLHTLCCLAAVCKKGNLCSVQNWAEGEPGVGGQMLLDVAVWIMHCAYLGLS